MHHLEGRAHLRELQPPRGDVGARLQAVGHHPLVHHLRDHSLQVEVVETDHRAAVERHLVHEGEERGHDRVEVRVVVEVLGVHRGHHRDGGAELEEGAVGLVGLRDQELALAETGVGAEAVHAAADHHGGIEAARSQHRGHHGGGSGLAVGARDRDAVLEPHQLREHLGPRDHRDAALTRGRYFHVVARHRRGGDHHVRPLDLRRRVPHVDLGSQPLEPLHRLAAPGVGAGDPVAEREQDLGDAAHADAADAHEVDVLVLLEH